MDMDALADALRLAVDPPSGIGLGELQELVRDDSAEEWDVATASEHLNVSPHTLRYYERIGLVSVPRDHAGHRPTLRT